MRTLETTTDAAAIALELKVVGYVPEEIQQYYRPMFVEEVEYSLISTSKMMTVMVTPTVNHRRFRVYSLIMLWKVRVDYFRAGVRRKWMLAPVTQDQDRTVCEFYLGTGGIRANILRKIRGRMEQDHGEA